MTYLSEALKLYRNDPKVTDEWFAKMIEDAIAIDWQMDSLSHSLRALSPSEFSALVSEVNLRV